MQAPYPSLFALSKVTCLALFGFMLPHLLMRWYFEPVSESQTMVADAGSGEGVSGSGVGVSRLGEGVAGFWVGVVGDVLVAFAGEGLGVSAALVGEASSEAGGLVGVCVGSTLPGEGSESGVADSIGEAGAVISIETGVPDEQPANREIMSSQRTR